MVKIKKLSIICPKCGDNKWVDNKRRGTTFCLTCGYVIGDLSRNLE